jgi:plastocyanin
MESNMKLAMACSVLLVLCLLSVSSADKKATGASHDVVISQMKFDPAQIEIAAGDKVVWTNKDDRDHTVVATDGSFKSSNLSKGDTFEHTFKKAGKFSYACAYHPRMKAIVIVDGN